MKVDHVTPCNCCDHEPNSGDSVYYGMPALRVTDVNRLPNGKVTQYWKVECPVCGVGGMFQFKSPYLALKHWNELQESIRRANDIWFH